MAASKPADSPPASSRSAATLDIPGTPHVASIQNTAIIGISAGSGVAVLIYLCHPTWPPPDAILSIVWGTSLPLMHLIGRGIYRRVAEWSGDAEAPSTAEALAAAIAQPEPKSATVPVPNPGAPT